MKYNYILISFIAALLFNSCQKDFEFQDFNYESYNRLVGPEGGTINFYANYSNDTKNEVIATIDVPEGALDSLMVFNMYQFEDFEVTTQMENGFAKIGSKLIYFVPFYESEGYHERGQFELNYHLSVKFKQPATVTYHPLANFNELTLENWQDVELYTNYYKTTNYSYKVYRIKIPRIDQWGENYNIYVNWTKQGYANGYDPTDVAYLVNGRWSAGDNWGKGEISIDNWELVPGANLNIENDEVTFQIFDTDYIYVVAREINLPFIPGNLTGYIDANFSIAAGVKGASFDDEFYKVYYTDNTIAVFNRNQEFQYLINDYAVLPPDVSSYIKINYPTSVVKKVSLMQYIGWGQYEIVLSGGIKLYFYDYITYQVYYRSTEYGLSVDILSNVIKTYLQINHPGEIVTNVTRNTDSNNNVNYVIYLNTNAKLYFYGDNWNETVYFKMNPDKLPKFIFDFVLANFPDPLYSEIDYKKGIESSGYDIFLVGNIRLFYSETGDYWNYQAQDFPVKNLPQAVKDSIAVNYRDFIISNVNKYCYSDIQIPEGFFAYFDIFFTNSAYIRMDDKGNIMVW